MTQDPVTLVAALRNTLEDTGRDFSSMPFFVRPMVRGGFARRTGQLEQLAENYRTAPERASKGMGALAGTLQRVQESSRRREEAIRALIAWLG